LSTEFRAIIRTGFEKETVREKKRNLQLTEHLVCKSSFNAEGIGLRGAEAAGEVDIFANFAPRRVTVGIGRCSNGIVAL
jgi:hypothetical protein